MNGKLPDHIFSTFIADYDQERAALKSTIAEIEQTLEKVGIRRPMLTVL